MTNTIALIVAAGTSERMGGALPKPYMVLEGQTLLKRAVECFRTHPLVSGVRVVIRREHHPLYMQRVDGLSIHCSVVGGNTRQESVRLGLESLAYLKPDRILVHDAARPNVTHDVITRVLNALDHAKGALPALAVTDTLKKANGNIVETTVPRDSLFTVQTPQGFDYNTLFAAHQQLKGQALTDDAALLERLGIPVALVEGDPQNIKITTPNDVFMMQNFLTQSHETRTGMGYDVHALKPYAASMPQGQKIIKLCGVAIPHSHYLEGHSDADVGLHALVDAILGAMGDGDIGTHFPPDNPKWKGADSERFLLHAYERLHQRKGEIINLDITLICEAPKIAPHRAAMIARISHLLKIEETRISIKATTTEKLGFAGRREGIAAQAIANVRMPREQ